MDPVITPKMRKAVEAARDAFWEEVVKAYPEAQTGDFAPDALWRWEQATEAAVQHWVEGNVPEKAQ